MTISESTWPPRQGPSISSLGLQWRQDYLNEINLSPPLKLGEDDNDDDAFYNNTVLRLPRTISENDLDDRIALDAQSLGLLPFRPTLDIDGITSSVSNLTTTSESLKPGSVQSSSTAPTSCASSEYRPTTHSFQPSENSQIDATTVPHLSDAEKRRRSPFSRGFRKMTGFRKRRSATLSSPTLTSIHSDTDTNVSEAMSIKSDLKSPTSDKSSNSSWSQPLSAPRLSHDVHIPVDPEGLQRSMECAEMLNLQMAQLEERARFLQYQVSLLAELSYQREQAKNSKRSEHDRIIAEHMEKRDRSVEDLEARQLEEELKIQKDHDLEKKAVLVRLRHMEAYCRNPTPPPTPVDPASGRPSMESQLPERKVTEKDYHNLAQQYRERDAMDTLHVSKINVLRGKQKKAVEALMDRRDREIAKLEKEQQKELAAIDVDFLSQETKLRTTLNAKRARLEARWRTQAAIERVKMEKATGLKYTPLPEVEASDNPHPDS